VKGGGDDTVEEGVSADEYEAEGDVCGELLADHVARVSNTYISPAVSTCRQQFCCCCD